MSEAKVPESDADWRELFQPGNRALRRNWAPILLLQILAAALVVSYYRFDGVRLAAKSIGDLKKAGGVPFVLMVGALSGGLIPQSAKAVVGQVHQLNRAFWMDTLYGGFVFAIIALEVNAFYLEQGVIFGTGAGALTLAKKTCFDMFVVSPLIFSPTGMFLFHARKVGFRASRMTEAFSWKFYRNWVIPTLPINWAFWIPIVICVYSLPSDLQLPFSQIAEACWSLVFIFIAKEAAAT
jgi:hypothetical protein